MLRQFLPLSFRLSPKQCVSRWICRALITLMLCSAGAQADEANYFLLTYSAGASWNDALDYDAQPGLKAHHRYVQSLHINDLVVMAGPVARLDQELLSVLLLRTGSIEEARSIAQQDPGVQTRIVRANVIPWQVKMTSMRFTPRRARAPVDDPDKTFSIKRIDPDSRINIED